MYYMQITFKVMLHNPLSAIFTLLVQVHVGLSNQSVCQCASVCVSVCVSVSVSVSVSVCVSVCVSE